jgi:hypothetical protein
VDVPHPDGSDSWDVSSFASDRSRACLEPSDKYACPSSPDDELVHTDRRRVWSRHDPSSRIVGSLVLRPTHRIERSISYVPASARDIHVTATLTWQPWQKPLGEEALDHLQHEWPYFRQLAL